MNIVIVKYFVFRVSTSPYGKTATEKQLKSEAFFNYMDAEMFCPKKTFEVRGPCSDGARAPMGTVLRWGPCSDWARAQMGPVLRWGPCSDGARAPMGPVIM